MREAHGAMATGLTETRVGRTISNMGSGQFELRFVVLRHEGVPEPHYDLMFETEAGSEQLAWRVDRWPLENGAPTQALAQHRRAYLDYDGPVTGNRGSVRQTAAGRHRVRQNHPVMLIVELEDGTVLRLFRKPEKSLAQVLRP